MTVKFENWAGYYRFFPETERELKRIQYTFFKETELLRKDNYFTFQELLPLKNFYLKGEKILNILECPQNILISPDEVHQLFYKLNYCYDYLSKTFFSLFELENNLDKARDEEDYNSSLPRVDINRPVISGSIEIYSSENLRVII